MSSISKVLPRIYVCILNIIYILYKIIYIIASAYYLFPIYNIPYSEETFLLIFI